MSTPMQKVLMPIKVRHSDGSVDTEQDYFYLASDVDARIADLERHLRRMLAFVDEVEVDIGQTIRGVTYYEAKKALGL